MIREVLKRSLPVALALALVVPSALAQLEQKKLAQKEIAPQETPYDTDREEWADLDSDGDTFPDLTEEIEGSDPSDPDDYPGAVSPEENVLEAQVGFPTTTCRSGYRQAGPRLCISQNVFNADSYADAMVTCRDRRGRVANYGDLRYLYLRTTLDAQYNPAGRWIGDIVGDNKALCGNKSITFNNDPDIGDFEGTCSRFDNRNFWCAHDDE